MPGAYFVTLVSKDWKPIFGRLAGEVVVLNEVGKIARDEWVITAKMRKEVRLDQFTLMPNHLHAILFTDELGSGHQELQREVVGAHGRAPLQRKARTLASLIAAYKATTTRRIREITANFDLKVWQRNYYDRVIRDQIELDQTREYILYNPLKLPSVFLK